MRKAIAFVAALLSFTGAASAAEVDGLWQGPIRHVVVRVEACGDAICGYIVTSDRLKVQPDLPDEKNKDAKLQGTASIGLVYLSRWESDEAADQFANLYADYLPKRYESLKKQSGKDPACDSDHCAGSFFFQTDEGPISIVRVAGSG